MLEMTVELERSRHLMNGVRTLKVMSEAQFLAGEDARGVLVMMEPETALSAEHLDALVARGAAGFVSDFTPERFEKPDEKPALAYDREKYAALLAVAVTPRQGVRLRTLAGTSSGARRRSLTRSSRRSVRTATSSFRRSSGRNAS